MTTTNEILAGLRCYDCGELFESPLDPERGPETREEWARLYPSHAGCFE